MNLLDTKYVAERVVVTFRFASGLGVGETLTGTPTVTARIHLGVDANPSAIVAGNASIVSTNVLQSIAGGVALNDYVLQATCTTSTGQILSVLAQLPVR
jgi:hypothetical protein